MGLRCSSAYNEKTEVTGAKDGAAGLATAKDSRVTVHFNDEAGAKVEAGHAHHRAAEGVVGSNHSKRRGPCYPHRLRRRF